jgi:uncharacterized repeat protein (TIGR03803 family)
MFGKKPGMLFLAAFGLLCGLLTIAAPGFAASKEKVLYSFCAAQLCPDGESPMASLVFDAAGNLYGTADYGGNSNCIRGCGTVFELTLGGNGKWKQKVLHRFEDNGKDGYYPAAGLIFDAAGNLYGTTAEGGVYQAGTVFELMPEKGGKWKEKILHNFGNSADGSEPLGSVVLDAAGYLYGTTFYGGAYGDGTVFKLAQDKSGHWTENVLHNFDWNGEDGFSSRASVILDNSGNLYGTTVLGGTGGNGTVFEMTRGKNGSWAEKVLYSFTGGTDGSLANAGLVFDAAGSLYSTTVAGGSNGIGNVFKLTRNAKGNWTLTTLYSFENADGAFPEGGVIFDATGNLYGTTFYGGAYNDGTVFKLAPDKNDRWTEKVLHDFNANGVDGYEPYGGLIMDAAGNLYGTTSMGGDYNSGTVCEITP